MKINNIILSLLFYSAINAQYIIDLTILECTTKINNNDIKDCKDLTTNEKPDYNWFPVDFNLNQYDMNNFNNEFRYLAYKKLEQSSMPAITNINVTRMYDMFDSKNSGCSKKMSVPLKRIPKDITESEKLNYNEYIICYELDKNNTPNAETEVLLDIKFTTNNEADIGYQICNVNLNSTPNNFETDPINNPISSENDINTSYSNSNRDNKNNIENNDNNSKLNPNNENNGKDFNYSFNRKNEKSYLIKRNFDNQFFLEFQIGRPKVATTTQSEVIVQIPTEAQTIIPSTTVDSNPPLDTNNNTNGVTKVFVVLSVVSISTAISIAVFVSVNRYRRFDLKMTQEELHSNLPWKISSSHQNNDLVDPIYGASLPQMENALNSNKIKYPEPSFNRNNNGYNLPQNTFNNINVEYSMNSTLKSRMMNSINGRSIEPLGTQPSIQAMDNMNQNIPLNQNYPPNGMGFINQPNLNIPSMNTNTLDMNSELNMSLNYSFLTNDNNYQNCNTATSTLNNVQSNYKSNYQPTTTQLTNQSNQNYEAPQQQRDFEIMNNKDTINDHHILNSSHSNNFMIQNNSNNNSVHNSINMNRLSTTIYNYKQLNNDKNISYISNSNENEIDNESDNSKVIIEDDRKELLGSMKLTVDNKEKKNEHKENKIQEKTIEANSYLIMNNTKSFNFSNNIQMDDLDNSLNLTNIESINSTQDLIDENNNINPKHLSKRTSTIINTDQESLLSHSDENIQVIAGYDARELDELTLQIGDVITVKEVYSDGWGIGINNSTNEQGIFPIVCLARKPDLIATE